MHKKLGIYIHIPFCESKCAYCDFYSLPGQDAALMDGYLKALSAHITESSEFIGKKNKNGYLVDTLYFGGGTPTVFGEKRLISLLKTINKRFNMAQNPEISVEANPDSADLPLLKKLFKAGFNRLSIGVQSTHQPLLKTLGRIHNSEEAADCVRNAKAAGFKNISVDLMYGIPGQTTEKLLDTLNAVFTWGVRHISLYGLKLEENTPMFKQNLSLPDDDEQANMYMEAVETLENKGFKQYEISNFAKEGHICRHNMKYWTLEPYAGFGAGAHSDLDNRRYAYIKSVKRYIEGINTGGTVVSEMNEIAMPERAGEYIMCNLRTTNGISGNEYVSRYKFVMNPIEEKLRYYEKYGYCKQEGDRWTLTPKGFLVSNKIIADLQTLNSQEGL